MRAIRIEPAPDNGSETSIPDPQTRFVRLLATHAFEAVEGIRSITHLGYALTVGAARQLALQRNALQERNAVYHDPRQCTASPGRVQLCPVRPGIVEAAVVVHTERRSHAVALRLEWSHSRWRACEVHVL